MALTVQSAATKQKALEAPTSRLIVPFMVFKLCVSWGDFTFLGCRASRARIPPDPADARRSREYGFAGRTIRDARQEAAGKDSSNGGPTAYTRSAADVRREGEDNGGRSFVPLAT
jgi:hypothetical protein